MCRHSQLLSITYNLTFLSCHKFPLAAIVASGNRILSVGINQYKTSPMQINPYTNKIGNGIHAEFCALRGFKKGELIKSVIYIVRRHKDRTYALARPCKECMKIIRNVGIKKIVYSIENNFIVEKI